MDKIRNSRSLTGVYIKDLLIIINENKLFMNVKKCATSLPIRFLPPFVRHTSLCIVQHISLNKLFIINSRFIRDQFMRVKSVLCLEY